MKKRRRRREVGRALKDWEIAARAALGTLGGSRRGAPSRAQPHPTKPPSTHLTPPRHPGTSDCHILANSCPFGKIFGYSESSRQALSVRCLRFVIRGLHTERIPLNTHLTSSSYLETSDCRISANSCPFGKIFGYSELPRRALSIRCLQFVVRGLYAKRIPPKPHSPAYILASWARNLSSRLNTSSTTSRHIRTMTMARRGYAMQSNMTCICGRSSRKI
jgi:hypothetical protein